MKNNIHIIKVEDNKNTIDPSASKQKDKNNLYLKPEIDFSVLYNAYDNSFLIGGIIDKVAQMASSWWRSINDSKNKDKLDVILQQIDLEFVFSNLLVYGNCFLEFQASQDKKHVWVYNIIATDVDIQKTSDGYWYKIDNVVMPKENIFHTKRISLRNKYYWDCIFSKCVPQVSLLAKIDRMIEKYFDRWLIKAKMFMDTLWALDKEEREVLKALIQDQMRWLENSYSTAIIPTDIKELSLQDDLDFDKVINLRNALIKSIAIATNIPYDLLVSDNSNRSTAEVAKELVEIIISPLQIRFVQQLRSYLVTFMWLPRDEADKIDLIDIDTSVKIDDMRVWTWYKNSGIITANEARTNMWYEAIEGWDTLDTRPQPTLQDQSNFDNMIEKRYIDNNLLDLKKYYDKKGN